MLHICRKTVFFRFPGAVNVLLLPGFFMKSPFPGESQNAQPPPFAKQKKKHAEDRKNHARQEKFF
ncbi:hypothetical protein DFS30_10450 [Akkermansia muciniphila]|nr:hypothetical protein CXT98_05940 [Akkermansia muciniphila]QAA39719.1 hypothetical protein C1I90_11040 [Akkermansia muciniphila]QAA42099.1 hypothetical protein C1I94_11265 [Akkermansia muciniphila]QAA65110.1 hypothetical protein C1O60_10670 [Akkermansia muciniphila]QAA67374.1 hypothetical protein C1O61_10790 [Akkermansia muciniphila]